MSTTAGLLGRCTFPPPGEPLVCAVSGGPDSLALLVLATAAGCDVTAVHVDHGLRPGSGAEADLVAGAAAHYGAAFRGESVHVEAGPNLEARARRARRHVLGPRAATGHTMDDQAETVLVNLLRGAGRDGLAGMRVGPGHPLLAIRRAEAAALCAAEGLRPVDDPTNRDPRYLRNRVRHELLPLCCAVAGRDLVPVLARQAGVLAGEADLLDGLASALDPTDARGLARADPALARRAVRRWLRDGGPGAAPRTAEETAAHGLPAPEPPARDGESHPPDLGAVERVLAVARGEAAATDVAPGLHVRRSGGRLSIAPGGPPRVRR